MDRLPLVAFLLFSGACTDGARSTTSTPPPSRFDAVQAAPAKATPVEEFCEKRASPAEAPAYTWPELDAPAAAAAPGEWTWVNIWATWCGPCVAEMPMIDQWPAKLAREGHNVAIRYLSVDATAEDVTKFTASHPKLPTGARVKDYGLVAPWLGTVGVDAGAVIPIHLFVDPSQKVRCVRMGALEASDYDTVKRILAAG